MEDTYIKAYRKLLKWRWADNPNMLALWIRLLLIANYEEKGWHNITVKRGQVVTSVAKLSVESGLSKQQIRTCLERLKDTEEIVIESTNKYTIITICNYDCYQSNDKDSQQTNNKQITNEQQTNNKQITTTKESKEGKESKESIKRDKSLSPRYTEEFEQVWQLYGRKGSKNNAFLRWKKLSDEDKKAAMIHIPYYLRTNEQQYLLDFEGYLNQRRFESPAVVKSTGQMLYDPDQGEQQSYNPDTSLHSDVGPSTDFGMVCKADRNPYTDTIRDGYTNDTRPDGALLYFKNGYDSHRWDAQAKVWRKVEGHWDVEQHKWIVEG